MINVLITGANGFIGKNLKVALTESGCTVATFSHKDDLRQLKDKVINADIIYHLAGVNRPLAVDEFLSGNTEFTEKLLELASTFNPKVKLIYTSSSQADNNNPYGLSKLKAENAIINSAEKYGLNVSIYRLPGVFGKWCRPDYNSVVATFCNNVINNVPLRVDNPEFILNLVYIDDVITHFKKHLEEHYCPEKIFCEIETSYQISLEKLASTIQNFKNSRTTLVTDAVGKGLIRALYATYLSYLPTSDFSYTVPVYEDERGGFAELLKTPTHGQFSFFTAKPGIVRGGHYHHTKNEKFIVVSGSALFKFEHILTGEIVEFEVYAQNTKIVDTIPGWAHNIKNTGTDTLIVMLWANEIFERDNPDTVSWSM